MITGTTCWICGDAADSREHMIKATDIRGVLRPEVSQANPLYLHNDQARNQPIGGVKSKKLKYTQVLCSACNNERTQEHDYAWEKLSEYLRNRNPPLKAGQPVNLSSVFPGCGRSSMLKVHLFFLKQFGCLIAENNIPLDLKPFAEAILNEKPHPDVHIAFWVDLNKSGRRVVGRTPVQTECWGGQIGYAGWVYMVGPISVNVMYSLPHQHRHGMLRSWHPSTVGKRIFMVGKY